MLPTILLTAAPAPALTAFLKASLLEEFLLLVTFSFKFCFSSLLSILRCLLEFVGKFEVLASSNAILYFCLKLLYRASNCSFSLFFLKEYQNFLIYFDFVPLEDKV